MFTITVSLKVCFVVGMLPSIPPTRRRKRKHPISQSLQTRQARKRVDGVSGFKPQSRTRVCLAALIVIVVLVFPEYVKTWSTYVS
ncbi:hypothetical protein BDW22DRAFT_281727 [Trametopsis cervina]|nr:hypothetical protein BDW22DRAFT_281727 [Trametopsis cervina]